MPNPSLLSNSSSFCNMSHAFLLSCPAQSRHNSCPILFGGSIDNRRHEYLPQPSHVLDVLSVWVAGANASTVASPPSFVMMASDAASARGSRAPICKQPHQLQYGQLCATKDIAGSDAFAAASTHLENTARGGSDHRPLTPSHHHVARQLQQCNINGPVIMISASGGKLPGGCCSVAWSRCCPHPEPAQRTHTSKGRNVLDILPKPINHKGMPRVAQLMGSNSHTRRLSRRRSHSPQPVLVVTFYHTAIEERWQHLTCT
jgi:hypothetical protein